MNNGFFTTHYHEPIRSSVIAYGSGPRDYVLAIYKCRTCKSRGEKELNPNPDNRIHWFTTDVKLDNDKNK